MPNLIEHTATIVSAHLSNIQMTSDEMLQELQKVHKTLTDLEANSFVAAGSSTFTRTPMLTIRQAFKKDQVVCMVCGKKGLKTLKRHLNQAHQLTPKQYRTQFGIPSSQKLAARSYSESRRQMAIDKGLGEGLAKARDLRNANMLNAPIVKANAPVPSSKTKSPLPADKESSVPAIRSKAPVPAVRQKAAVPAKVVSPKNKKKQN